MDQSKNNNSEEVDLGQLFNAIGAGIRSVFRFFKNLLFGLANWALEGILFVRQRFLVFGIISCLGDLGDFLTLMSTIKTGLPFSLMRVGELMSSSSLSGRLS